MAQEGSRHAEGGHDPLRRTERAEQNQSEQAPAIDAMTASRNAMDQLSMLTQNDPEGVSRLEYVDDGWLFQIEMVELRRIPDSTSILASYEVHLDNDGNVLSYQRTRRYSRNQAGEL